MVVFCFFFFSVAVTIVSYEVTTRPQCLKTPVTIQKYDMYH